ncbi:MAG: hypothetical protein OEV64_10065, partial [Desulfobulbaceae bacterium]|nr:hypothetical protein [Desulfobulbaceae bacterium]
MKPHEILSYLLTFLLFSLAGSTVSAKDNPFVPPKLPFKEAIIHYEVSGTSNGTETLYIRKHGQETAHRSKMMQKIMFMTQQTDTLEITTPEYNYSIDFINKQGKKSTNPQKYMQEEYDKLSGNEKKIVDNNMKEMGYAGMNMMQGNLVENESEILGYKCDKMEFMGNTVYSIHKTGIPLKTITKMMGMNFTSAAVKIDKGGVSSDMFVPPPGIPMLDDPDGDQIARDQAQQMIAMLKDENAAEKMKQNTQQLIQAHQQNDSSETDTEQNAPDDPQMEESINKAMETL